jgi:hypothetical protein
MSELAADSFTELRRKNLNATTIFCVYCGASNSKYRRECWKCKEELGA